MAKQGTPICTLLDMDSQAFSSLLKHCRSAFDVAFVHTLLVQSPLHSDRFLGNMLTDTYGHSGALDDALSTFSSIPSRNVISWNIIIRTCVTNGHALRALSLFESMLLDDKTPDRITFLSVISACAHLKDLQEARRWEACIAKSYVGADAMINSGIINMYHKCGSLEDAERIFNGMLDRDVVCWNTMIAAYSQLGEGRKALALFQEMARNCIDPSQATYCTLISLCAKEGLLDEGRHLDACLRRSSLPLDVALGNALICMYGKCGSLQEAHDVFSNMHVRDAITWSTIMSASINNGRAFQAIELYYQMQIEAFITDTAVITSSVCACACSLNLASGKRFHACLAATNLILDAVASTALVNMYGKCEWIEGARDVFDELVERDVVAHSAMVAAFSWCGLKKEAIQQFYQMQLESMVPGRSTFVTVFDACGSSEGMHLHTRLWNTGCSLDNEMGTALICMYGKQENLQQAERILEELPDRDVVLWNAMISVYIQLERYCKAFQCFQQLQLESLTPSAASFAIGLSACVTQAALTDGKRMHAKIAGASLDSDVIVATALINMYAKCGSLERARMAFDALSEQSSVTWNALVAAHAQHGHSKEALRLFNAMLSQRMRVDAATFSSVLSACSRAGYVDEGLQCFISMLQTDGMRPTVQHYNCLIDLVSRAGRLEEGESVMSLMPARPIGASWTSLLSACRAHLDSERGNRIANTMSTSKCEGEFVSSLVASMLVLTG